MRYETCECPSCENTQEVDTEKTKTKCNECGNKYPNYEWLENKY